MKSTESTEIIVADVEMIPSQSVKKAKARVVETRLAKAGEEGAAAGVRLLSVTQMIGIEKRSIQRAEELMQRRKQELADLVKEKTLLIREGKERIKLLERVKKTLERQEAK